MYIGSPCNELNDAKETARCKWVHVVTELSNFAVMILMQTSLPVTAGCSLLPYSL